MKDQDYFLLYDIFGLYQLLNALYNNVWYSSGNEFAKLEERKILLAIRWQKETRIWKA